MIGGNRRELSPETLGRNILRARIKGSFFDRQKVFRMIGEMNERVLGLLGKNVQEAAKAGIGRGKGRVKKAAQRRTGAGRVVEFVGGLYQDITTLSSGEPRPGGQPARSWAPKRFLYNDIMYFYDSAKGTAVIGTLKSARWLAQLHQFGGVITENAWRSGVGRARNAYLRQRGNGRQGRDEKGRYTRALPQANQYQYGLLRWHPAKSGPFRYSRKWERTSMTRTATYPARPYMQGSARVDKAIEKANERWRNQLRKAA
jgi:phage gpG-like protein